MDLTDTCLLAEAQPAAPHLSARGAAASARLRERGGEREAHASGHGAHLTAAAGPADLLGAAGQPGPHPWGAAGAHLHTGHRQAKGWNLGILGDHGKSGYQSITTTTRLFLILFFVDTLRKLFWMDIKLFMWCSLPLTEDDPPANNNTYQKLGRLVVFKKCHPKIGPGPSLAREEKKTDGPAIQHETGHENDILSSF